MLSENIDKKYDELREIASDNHERFREAKEKIDHEKRDKEAREQELLDKLQETIAKIAKLKAYKQKMDSKEFDEKLQVVNNLKLNTEKKIEEYRLKKENEMLLNKVIKSQPEHYLMQKELEERERLFEKTAHKLNEEQNRRFLELIQENKFKQVEGSSS